MELFFVLKLSWFIWSPEMADRHIFIAVILFVHLQKHENSVACDYQKWSMGVYCKTNDGQKR